MATNIERPIIAGTPLVGQRLTTRSGVWTGLTQASVFTWKWELDGGALPFTSWECTPSKAGWLKLTVTADGTSASSDTIPIKINASDPNPPLPNQPSAPSVLTNAQKKTLNNYITTMGGWKTTLTKMLQIKSPTQLNAVLSEIETVRTRLRGIIASSVDTGGGVTPTLQPTTYTLVGSASYGGYTGHTGTGSGLRDGVNTGGSSVAGVDSAGKIAADLGEVKTVSKIQLVDVDASFDGWGVTYAQDMTIDYSSDSTNGTNGTWTVFGVANSHDVSATGVLTDFVMGVSARWVRVTRSPETYLALGDFYVWASGGTPDTTAPTITSSDTASVAENATLSKALTANEPVTWSITGGADQAKFELSGSTLRWASNGTKNHDAPDDADTNNTYVVQVTATDGSLNATNQTITVTVTADVTAPTITSSNTATVADGQTLSKPLSANESVTWTITGGADQADFEISGNTLRWASNGTKDFDAPDDADLNNTYVVQVTATDVEGLTQNQTITVTVADASGFDEASELPHSEPNKVLETSFANTYTVTSGDEDDFQTKINTARSTAGNSVINVPVATYDFPSGLNIPVQTNGAGTLLIRSANHASLPAAGTRIIPGTHAANMPIIRMVTANNQTLAIPINSDDVQLRGLEITFFGVDCTHLIYLGSDSESTLATNQPNNIIIAQCYIHGNPYPDGLTNGIGRAIRAEARNLAIVDNHIDDIYRDDETQCINFTNTPGPMLIENNYLSGGAENIMIGGGDPQISGMVASDITIRGNDFDKNPDWFGISGVPVKNHFETKFGVRVLIEGNVFRRLPVEEQDGYCLNINNLTQSGASTWTTTQDITIRHNVMYDCVGFVVLNCNQLNAGQYTVPGARYSVHDNVGLDIGSYNGTTLAYWFNILGTGESGAHMEDVYIKHNTVISNAQTSGRAFNLAYGTGINAVITDNVLSAGHIVVNGDGVGSGMNAWDTFWPGSYDFSGNILINEQNGDPYPGNTKVASIALVGFDNPATKDYRISSGTYVGKGADWDAVRTATFGVVTAGQYVLAA